MKHALSIALVILGLLSVVAACNSNSSWRPTFPKVPDYPNAQQMTVGPVEDTEDAPPTQHISFVTSDTESMVLAFYKNELPKQRWGIDLYSAQGEQDKGRNYVLEDGCQLTKLQIAIAPAVNGQIHVELILRVTLCG